MAVVVVVEESEDTLELALVEDEEARGAPSERADDAPAIAFAVGARTQLVVTVNL